MSQLFKFLKYFSYLITFIILLKYIMMFFPLVSNTPKAQNQQNSQSVKKIEDGEVIRLTEFENCIAQKREEVSNHFHDQLGQMNMDMQMKYQISNDSDEDDFIDWLNGWGNGYRLMFNSILDKTVSNGNVEELIEEHFEKIVLLPVLQRNQSKIEKIFEESINDYLYECSSIAMIEQNEIAHQRESTEDYEINWHENGAIIEMLSLISDDSEEIMNDHLDQKKELKQEFNQYNNLTKTENVVTEYSKKLKSLKKLRNVKNLKNFKKIASEIVNQSGQKTVTQHMSGKVGSVVGGVSSGLALKMLASKGLAGKTSVILFKFAGSKIATNLGIASTAKLISAKAASIAGGKLLFLIADKSVVAATGAMTLGVSVLLDYFIAKGIGATQRAGMEKDFSLHVPSIENAIIQQYASRLSEILNEKADVLKLDVNVEAKKIKEVE